MTPELMRFIEKSLLIQVMDAVWKEHLYALDHLRQGIGLRAYGQRDPLNEYKSEAFALFNAMLDELKERVTAMLARVELAPEGPAAPMPPPRPVQMFEHHPEPEMAFAGAGEDAPPATLEMRSGAAAMGVSVHSTRADAVDPNDPATWRNAARNGACPCGSGKKYKHCHGKLS
jgi:preprotein translocase subunit SecA